MPETPAELKARLEEEYYNQLAEENDIYSERPSRKQVGYIDTVVSGISSHLDAVLSVGVPALDRPVVLKALTVS